MNKALLRESVEIGGILSAFMGTIALLTIWTFVYVNGGSVTITVTTFGERYVELVLFWLTVPVLGVSLWLYLRGPER